MKLRPNPNVPAGISIIPAIEVTIREQPHTGKTGSGKGKGKAIGADSTDHSAGSIAVLEDFSATMEGGGRLAVICTANGISHTAVLERRERQVQRQKKAEKRRRREEKARNERRVQREQEREQQRMERLAERKAKKLAERQARRRRAEAASGVTSGTGLGRSPNASSNNLSNAPPPPPPPSGSSRNSTTTRDSSSNNFSSTNRSSASSNTIRSSGTFSIGDAASNGKKLNPVEKARPSFTGNASSSGNNDLQAALAKRRAKDNDA